MHYSPQPYTKPNRSHISSSSSVRINKIPIYKIMMHMIIYVIYQKKTTTKVKNVLLLKYKGIYYTQIYKQVQVKILIYKKILSQTDILNWNYYFLTHKYWQDIELTWVFMQLLTTFWTFITNRYTLARKGLFQFVCNERNITIKTPFIVSV